MNPQLPLPHQPPLPRLRLDFYDMAVLLSRWEEDGRLLTHRPQSQYLTRL